MKDLNIKYIIGTDSNGTPTSFYKKDCVVCSDGGKISSLIVLDNLPLSDSDSENVLSSVKFTNTYSNINGICEEMGLSVDFIFEDINNITKTDIPIGLAIQATSKYKEIETRKVSAEGCMRIEKQIRDDLDMISRLSRYSTNIYNRFRRQDL